MSEGRTSQRRIAVIGAGVSGLGAAWALSREHDVTLFETNPRVGGHANTATIEVDGRELPVDTGFIVYNELNYPHLMALFDHLEVETAPSDMSFGVSLDAGRLEYSGSGVRGLFAQRSNVLSPRFWHMLRDIRRFYAAAPGYLADGAGELTLAGLLARHEYGVAFTEDHLIPMAAAIWSASREDIRGYPADAFIRFFMNHGLLSLTGRPQWRTVVGGSREYVGRLLDDADVTVAKGTGIKRVRRTPNGVTLIRDDGLTESFDEVVIATHADEALRLLADPCPQERAVLGAFRYSDNRAWLHQDASLMPQRRAAWSSWNYTQPATRNERAPLAVTYWMNRLQPLATREDVFVTLNPSQAPREDSVHGVYDYTHPVFSKATAVAQDAMHRVQGSRHTWFCGAYWGCGFHEDGLQSGLWVARQLGATLPWSDIPFDRMPARSEPAAARAA